MRRSVFISSPENEDNHSTWANEEPKYILQKEKKLTFFYECEPLIWIRLYP